MWASRQAAALEGAKVGQLESLLLAWSWLATCVGFARWCHERCAALELRKEAAELKPTFCGVTRRCGLQRSLIPAPSQGLVAFQLVHYGLYFLPLPDGDLRRWLGIVQGGIQITVRSTSIKLRVMSRRFRAAF